MVHRNLLNSDQKICKEKIRCSIKLVHIRANLPGALCEKLQYLNYTVLKVICAFDYGKRLKIRLPFSRYMYMHEKMVGYYSSDYGKY